jgi:hypothetical protein
LRFGVRARALTPNLKKGSDPILRYGAWPTLIETDSGLVTAFFGR